MRTLLIVDDNDENRYLLRSLLEKDGYRVQDAADGAQALQIAREQLPDAVVTDLLMPGMDGFSLCREWMRDQRLRGAPFIVYTATYTNPEDRQLILDLGASRFILKPVEHEELVRHITTAIEEMSSGAPELPATGQLSDEEFHAQHCARMQQKLGRKLAQLQEADKRLADYAARAEAVLDATPSAIISIDPERRIKTWNLGAERLFGYMEEEVLDRPLDIIIPEDKREEATQRLAEAQASKSVVRWETQRLAKNDRRVDVAIALSYLGSDLGHVAVVTDITEKRELGSRLETVEARLERFLAVSGTVLYSLQVRQEGLLPVWVSDNLQRVMGYSTREVMSPDWWAGRIHPEDRETAMKAAHRILSEGRLTHEYRFMAKTGEYRVIHDEMILLRDREGQPSEVVGAWLDVTEVRRADEERRSLEAQLATAQRMESIGRLAGGVAHDFNNLLTVIVSHAGLLEKGLRAADPLQENAAQIQKAAERATSLTGQLLTLSRKQAIQPRVMDLNETIRSMKEMLQRLLGEDIDVRTVLSDDLGRVKADESQIEQVILNLAVNARDAMPAGGWLIIQTVNREIDSEQVRSHSSMRPGSYVMISMADKGIGMDRHTLEHAFEPFFTTKEHGKGTGLGLATVYGIVEQNNGFVWVESEPGRGATFQVFLPRVHGPITRPAPTRELEDVRGKGEIVLVVEDDEMVRHISRKLLEHLGYRVLDAASGPKALLLAERFEEEIHLLLTDVVMPGMNGKELAERLLSTRPSLKVLFTSGYTDEAIVHHGILDPDISLVEKPFSAEKLAPVVRAVLDGRRPGGVGK